MEQDNDLFVIFNEAAIRFAALPRMDRSCIQSDRCAAFLGVIEGERLGCCAFFLPIIG